MTQFTDGLHNAFNDGKRVIPDFGMKIDTDVEAMYSQLCPLITSQEELDDAYIKTFDLFKFLIEKLSGVNDIFPNYAPMAKTYERYTAKLAMEGRPDRYFKAICDIGRMRLLTERVAVHAEIISDKLQEYVTQYGGAYTVRATWLNKPDLVQYVYVYTPGGYVCEVQIIHPFAAKVFKADSERREGYMSSPDYWANDFYSTVKSCILEQGMNLKQIRDSLQTESALKTSADTCIANGSFSKFALDDVLTVYKPIHLN
jgi:hypothetical protein